MVSRLARLCCWRQKFDVYNERLSSSLFSIPTGVGVKKRFCFRHRSAFRLLVDVLLFSFQGSCCWSLFQQQLLYLIKILLLCQQKVLLIYLLRRS